MIRRDDACPPFALLSANNLSTSTRALPTRGVVGIFSAFALAVARAILAAAAHVAAFAIRRATRGNAFGDRRTNAFQTRQVACFTTAGAGRCAADPVPAMPCTALVVFGAPNRRGSIHTTVAKVTGRVSRNHDVIFDGAAAHKQRRDDA